MARNGFHKIQFCCKNTTTGLLLEYNKFFLKIFENMVDSADFLVYNELTKSENKPTLKAIVMFLVKAGSPILAIQHGKEWFPQNFKSHITKHDNVFDKEDLIVDPTGIAKHANIPGGVTIGSGYAEAGYFGFTTTNSNWIMLVHSKYVKYG
jgi:hypothetical protein